MLDLSDRGCFLEMRILQKKTIYETAMNVYINVLVDGRRDDKSAVLTIIGRQVSTAAAERDSQWRARDDHSGFTSSLANDFPPFVSVRVHSWLIAPDRHLTSSLPQT